MEAQPMWTITEDDNSMVSTHQSPMRQVESNPFDQSPEIRSQNNGTPEHFRDNQLLSPGVDGRHLEEDFGPLTDYSQNSFNFFAESPAPSPITHDSREVFQSDRSVNIDGRRRPQSANPHNRCHQPERQSEKLQWNTKTLSRPSSANNVHHALPHNLKTKGKSSSFGHHSEPVMMPLNDLKEQRKTLDQLPRSKRLVRRMESPVGITLLQLDERDMLVGKDLSKDGRVRSRQDMEVPRHVRKRDRDHRKEVYKSIHETTQHNQRPRTGTSRKAVPLSQRPLSASPRVQRSQGWQDGSRDKRVEWSESDVSGVEDDDEDDPEYGWLFDSASSDHRPHRDVYEKDERNRTSRVKPTPRGALEKGLLSRVEALGNALRADLQQRPFTDICYRELDTSRKGFFGLPDLIQLLSDAQLACTLVEAEELLGSIAGQRGQSRASLQQLERFYRGASASPKSQPKSAVASQDLHSLLANLELRASKLKFPTPSDSDTRKETQNSEGHKTTATRTQRGATSIILI